MIRTSTNENLLVQEYRDCTIISFLIAPHEKEDLLILAYDNSIQIRAGNGLQLMSYSTNWDARSAIAKRNDDKIIITLLHNRVNPTYIPL